MVKVRFAPSPTGYLHIGGARTALFNWLFARHNKGSFVLRIEDTDRRRSKKRYLDEILNSLNWLGLGWDEIYFQSQRFKLYREYAQRLLEVKKAHRHQGAIKFRLPLRKLQLKDLIHGTIEFDTSLIKEQVLIKSDGTPTYNFACVIDDATLGITHVIRGDDHISNTPKQLALYQALGLKVPEFAHLPLILGKDGGRLSKRTGATPITDYKKKGYLPEAIVNYLLLLGWSPGENREVIDFDEIIPCFRIEEVNKTAAVFDLNKLNWINSQYIRKADAEELADLIIPLLNRKGYIKEDFNRDYLLAVIKLFQARLTTLSDFLNWASFFFTKRLSYETEAKNRLLQKDLSKEFYLLMERIKGLCPFDSQTVEVCFRNLVSELGISSRQLIHPVRAALTGKTVGPGLFEVISTLGKDEVLKRLNRAARLMRR